jgi:hypothetical protein
MSATALASSCILVSPNVCCASTSGTADKDGLEQAKSISVCRKKPGYMVGGDDAESM